MPGVSFLPVVDDRCAFTATARDAPEAVSLPERGADGILLDHELEFEMLLGVTNRSAVSRKLTSLTPSRPSRPYFADTNP